MFCVHVMLQTEIHPLSIENYIMES